MEWKKASEVGSIEFGDYISVEQKRYGVKNEFYTHKVIGRLKSNCWMDVPAITHEGMTFHKSTEDVVACICCGVCEETVIRYNLKDIHSVLKPKHESETTPAQVKFPLPSEWIAEFKEAWMKDNSAGYNRKELKDNWAETERVCNMIYKYQRKAFEAKQTTPAQSGEELSEIQRLKKIIERLVKRDYSEVHRDWKEETWEAFKTENNL